MQKNHQADKQFLKEVGVLLAARAGQGRIASPSSLSHLAEHIASARRHQKLTRAALALKMGVSEAEIYALEQGLLPYTELDLRFLGKLAVALNEDLATLLLLLGRPTLVQALQPPKAHCTEAHTTASKQRGNRLARRQWANALYNGCLNLIDSLRQGRLSSYSRVNYQLYPMAAVLLCIFLIGVSTYNLAGRFGAQSAMQASIPKSVQADDLDSVQHQRIIESTDRSTARSPQRLYQPVEAMTEPVMVSVGGSTPNVVLMAHHVASEAQQCVVLAGGRPAICRV